MSPLCQCCLTHLRDKTCGHSNNWNKSSLYRAHNTAKKRLVIFVLHFRVFAMRTRGRVRVCTCVSLSSGLNDTMINGRASVLSARPVRVWWWGLKRGGGHDSGCLRWSHYLMDTAVERPHSYWPLSLSLSLSRVACLIRPLLMESSGGTYRKYWSYFDRVFSPLHNQQCITATPLILCTQAHATTTSLDAIAEGGVTLISIPKQAKPVFACVKMFA